LRQRLRALGVPATQARTAAFRQLVLQAPAPVVARALGYSDQTATSHVIAAGGTWSRYPAIRPGKPASGGRQIAHGRPSAGG
jgi:hypothetical protein